MVGLEGSLKITELQKHIMVVLGGSLKIIEPWSVWIRLERSLKITEPQNHIMVVLGGSLKIIEPWSGTVGLGWKGP